MSGPRRNTASQTASQRGTARQTRVTGMAGLAGALLLTASAAFMALTRKATKAAHADPKPSSPLDEARLLGIIRSSMEAIITIDENQRIVMFNPAAERLFGCPAADALGTSLSRFLPERFRAGHAAHVRQFGVTGVSDRQMGGRRILYGLRANGDEFPFEASISQFEDDHGGGKLYTVMLRDISTQVDAERLLQRSHEELRELSANLLNVREEEKSRIARELHDDLGQQLTALKMDISSLELRAGTDAEARAQLRGMQRLIDTTVASMRRIAADLRPVMLDDLGLVPAIDWLANDFTNRYGIDVERRIDARHTIFSRDGATAVFRIVQEALTNVARHAQASRVDLALYLEGDRCILRIADDGIGAHERADTGRKSFGLIGIRERVHGLGGSVSIESGIGQGFAVTVTFPLATLQQDDDFFDNPENTEEEPLQ
ncbi:sensory box histidine kinase/response regulator [Caballeronia udeis]|uniref:Sensory box histidine kinase/response regulator n=1 Tax=Caballeronia udeis TaxID=1232866 RepID=A0A158GDT1_9BURK|nr:sensory box histidine kinase/response regulator [Caballeronia udeis]